MIFLRPNDALGQLVIDETFIYYDGPRLFVAENPAGQKFLINCLDSDETGDYWLSSAISERRLYALKDGTIPLREVFASPELGHVLRFSTSHNGELLDCHRIEPGRLTSEDLPDIDAVLQYGVEERQVQNAVFLAKRLNANVILLHLYPSRKVFEAPVRAVGKVLSSFEEYVSSKLSPLAQVDAQGAPELFQVNMVGTFAGSFGVEVAVRGNDPRIGALLRDAVDDLGTADNLEAFREQMTGVQDEEVGALKKFLSELKRAGSDLKIETASQTDTDPAFAQVSLLRIRAAIKTLKREPKIRRETRTLVAELVGINVRSRKFEITDVESGETFKGAIASIIFHELRTLELPHRYRVVIEADVRKTATGSEAMTGWRMISATKLL